MRGATFAVMVLTMMNLLNYLDRFMPSAVKDLFKKDLNLSDEDTSWPFTAFVLVYMIASPCFGSVADKGPRKILIAIGVAVWSLATAAGGLAQGFWSFLAARAMVGIGEAAYATISPSLISDFYPPERRNKVMTIFYVAIPVGAALGFTIGGFVGEHWSWRHAFMICGLPGLAVAAGALMIRDPGRGTFDAVKAAPASWGDALRAMWASGSYVNAVAGYVAVTFASGGMGEWFPTFLSRVHKMSPSEAGTTVGGVTLLGGLVGTAVGGLLGDVLRKHTRQPYLALSGLSMIPATLFAGLSLVAPDPKTVVGCIFLAQFFLWFYNGPINAMIANSVPSTIVARAFAISILMIHVLGDAISPIIIGRISDATGNLTTAVTIVPVALGVGAAIWIWGWRNVPEPQS